MFRKHVIPLIAAAILTAPTIVRAAAVADSRTTSITIDGMHCASCAKKVTARLRAVAGVADAQVNVESQSAKVTPQQKANVSPRSLWESVEKSGYTPTKLVGPSGSFTKKPPR